MFEIFCDMDGVLTDFDKKFYELTGIPPLQYKEYYSEQQFINIINSDIFFWKNLEPMPDAMELWEYIKVYKPTILTKPSGNIELCKKQKIDWVLERLGSDIKVVFSHNKYKYATPESILIDNSENNINDWKNAGGIGILHKNAKGSIKKLDTYLKDKHSAEIIIKKFALLSIDASNIEVLLQKAIKNNITQYSDLEKFIQLQLGTTDISVEEAFEALPPSDDVELAEYMYMILDSKTKENPIQDMTVSQAPNIAINVVRY